MELRALEARGRFVLCKYLDPTTLKPADNKMKLTLEDDEGRLTEYFILPLKTPKRALLLTAEKEEKMRKVWNEAAKREEPLWL